MSTLTIKHKIGIAVACLVAIIGIVVWDQKNLSRSDAPLPTTPVTLQTALTPVVAVPAPAPAVKREEPIAVPKDCAEEVKSAAAAVAKDVKPAPAATYTVVQGDSLYGISVKLFGTPRHYERLYEANRDRIRDPNTLQVGINLRMPEIATKPAPQ
jgi:nucleoid-associated protein YgaU